MVVTYVVYADNNPVAAGLEELTADILVEAFTENGREAWKSQEIKEEGPKDDPRLCPT